MKVLQIITIFLTCFSTVRAENIPCNVQNSDLLSEAQKTCLKNQIDHFINGRRSLQSVFQRFGIKRCKINAPKDFNRDMTHHPIEIQTIPSGPSKGGYELLVTPELDSSMKCTMVGINEEDYRYTVLKYMEYKAPTHRVKPNHVLNAK